VCNLQLLLLQESWKELFLLHLAQWSIPWDLSTLLNCSKARERIPNDEITNIELVTIQVRKLKINFIRII
jgi:nuclear receptor subfamily 2 group A